MSKVITQSLEGTAMHAIGLVYEFIKVCPEDIWGKKFGGWPVWQQIYHCFSAVDFFLRPADAEPEAPLMESGVGDLEKLTLEPAAKLHIRDYVQQCETRIKDYISGLDDASLAARNEGLSARVGREMTNAGTLALFASHTMYHLGSCEAALREQGLPGVF